MSSSPAPSRRRRPHSASEDEDNEGSSQQSSAPATSSNKRARTNGYNNDSDAESAAASNSQESASDEDDNEGGDVGIVPRNDEGFQPGSIRRVKVTNFVTYEKAEFFPGPNLNMVIGPNGTGKSSLVCAICLGLGYAPSTLGRAGEVGEFVKHGSSESEIEIELEKKPQDSQNYIIRTRIVKDGNKREYHLDGRKSTNKGVQELAKGLSIQIDNLCQFLPQDKVSEFAALSPVELLLHTQRAAAPEKMIQQHEELKTNRKEQKQFQQKQVEDQERLDSLENRQQNLQAEVQRLHERQEIQDKVMILKKRIPFIEYQTARLAHMEFKQKKQNAQLRLRALKERVQPILQSVQRKQALRDQVSAVIVERERLVKNTEIGAIECTKKLEALDAKIDGIDSALTTENGKETARKTALRRTQQDIKKIQVQMEQPAIEFDPKSWNDRIVSNCYHHVEYVRD